MKEKLMRNRAVVAVMLLWSVVVMPMAAVSQTAVRMPKNKYKVQDDIKLGADASRQVEQQFPLLNDRTVDGYVESVGQRLVSAIPAEFSQPAFRYEFDVVNARDINAFALPDGPVYVHGGMIEAARYEGAMTVVTLKNGKLTKISQDLRDALEGK
jgi:predicted Zn-dependent protease